MADDTFADRMAAKSLEAIQQKYPMVPAPSSGMWTQTPGEVEQVSSCRTHSPEGPCTTAAVGSGGDRKEL